MKVISSTRFSPSYRRGMPLPGRPGPCIWELSLGATCVSGPQTPVRAPLLESATRQPGQSRKTTFQPPKLLAETPLLLRWPWAGGRSLPQNRPVRGPVGGQPQPGGGGQWGWGGGCKGYSFHR